MGQLDHFGGVPAVAEREAILREAWDDLGNGLRETDAGTVHVRASRTPALIADWVRRGIYWPGWTRADIESAVTLSDLARSDAAKYARKHLRWVDAYELHYGRPYKFPPDEVVRHDWRRIGFKWLSPAERAEWDKCNTRLRCENPLTYAAVSTMMGT